MPLLTCLFGHFFSTYIFLPVYGKRHSLQGMPEWNFIDAVAAAFFRLGFFFSCLPVRRFAIGIYNQTFYFFWKTSFFKCRKTSFVEERISLAPVFSEFAFCYVRTCERKMYVNVLLFLKNAIFHSIFHEGKTLPVRAQGIIYSCSPWAKSVRHKGCG